MRRFLFNRFFVIFLLMFLITAMSAIAYTPVSVGKSCTTADANPSYLFTEARSCSYAFDGTKSGINLNYYSDYGLGTDETIYSNEIYTDLGQEYCITQVELYGGNDGANQANYDFGPQNITIDWSEDNVSWNSFSSGEKIYTKTGVYPNWDTVNNTINLSIDYDPAYAQYFRFTTYNNHRLDVNLMITEITYFADLTLADCGIIALGELTPPNNTIQSNPSTNISLYANSSSPFKATLQINGEINQTKSYDNGTNVYISFLVNLIDADHTFFINVTNGQTTDTHNINIDTNLPIATWTIPANDGSTLIGGSKSITHNIHFANTQLGIYNYNISNSTGILFSKSNNLSGNTTHTLDDVVDLTTQPDGVFSSSLLLCDLAENCILQTRNFDMDSTPPIVSNLLPLNNSLGDEEVIFKFYSSEDSNCSLYLNSTYQRSVDVLAGSNNTFSTEEYDTNQTVSWNVVCVDVAGNSGSSQEWILRIGIREFFPQFFQFGSCPADSLPNVMMIAFIGFFLLSLFIVGEVFIRIGVFNLFTGLGMIVFGIVLMGCSVFITAVTFLIGVGMIIVQFMPKANE